MSMTSATARSDRTELSEHNRVGRVKSIEVAAVCGALSSASGCTLPDGTELPLPDFLLNGVGSALENLLEAAVLTFVL